MGFDFEEILGADGDDIADAYDARVADAMAYDDPPDEPPEHEPEREDRSHINVDESEEECTGGWIIDPDEEEPYVRPPGAPF